MMIGKASSQSNLDSFLDCTTPIVPSLFLAKSEMGRLNRLWQPWERETIEYFSLRDLWNCYDEWSAYGAGVPISLTTGETLIQYYVPYLSAIQIFTSRSGSRDGSESGEGEMRDAFCDSCSEESETEKQWRSDGCSSEEGGGEHDGVRHLNDRLGYLYFQYFERCTPYARIPLRDKICEFARRFPGLFSLRSVDLSPASWMAVSWYPIYHIPVGRTIKDLSACFLTYHTLSSCFQDLEMEDDRERWRRKRKEGGGVALPAFGLSTYKMQGDVWLCGSDGHDQERLLSLFGIADSWLKQLRVQHHDFNYFLGIRHN